MHAELNTGIATVVQQASTPASIPNNVIGSHLQQENLSPGTRNVQIKIPDPVLAAIQVAQASLGSGAATKIYATTCELCCGSAGWSAAMIRHGIDALGIDYDRNPQKPKAPIVLANLATKEGQDQYRKLDSELKFDILHAAPPCGTASRAREKALPQSVLRTGIRRPMPLRSNSFPEGLPNLRNLDLLKVQLANSIYFFVHQECIDRHRQGRLFSIEIQLLATFGNSGWLYSL